LPKENESKRKGAAALVRLRRMPRASANLPGVCKLSNSANSFLGSFCGIRLRATSVVFLEGRPELNQTGIFFKPRKFSVAIRERRTMCLIGRILLLDHGLHYGGVIFPKMGSID
jgi:hypothetical protein